MGPNTSHKISHQLSQPCGEGQDSTKSQVFNGDADCEGSGFTGTQQGRVPNSFEILEVIHVSFFCLYSKPVLIICISGSDGSANESNLAQALQNIASALTQRNAIEERKLRVFENLLTVYAAKNGIAITDAVNLDRDQT